METPNIDWQIRQKTEKRTETLYFLFRHTNIILSIRTLCFGFQHEQRKFILAIV